MQEYQLLFSEYNKHCVTQFRDLYNYKYDIQKTPNFPLY